MAHIIPSDLTRAVLAGARSPELDTLRQLKDALPNDYTVFHGVHWAREYQAWTHFGEIDFVAINGASNVLLIEHRTQSSPRSAVNPIGRLAGVGGVISARMAA